jgi:enterobactin synthetase component D
MRVLIAPELDLPVGIPPACAALPLVISVVPVRGPAMQLLPEEEAVLGDALPKRRLEFAAGRAAARLAMAHLGQDPVAVTSNGDRAPVWPEGLVGSLTHTDNLALCALARHEHLAGIGIDLEQANAVTEDLFGVLFTRRELARIGSPLQATLSFSAKEAIYKAIHPLAGSFIDFPEVEIDWDQSDELGRFRARYLGSHAESARLEDGRGYVLEVPGRVLTLFLI